MAIYRRSVTLLKSFVKKLIGLDCISEHHFLSHGLGDKSVIVDLGANKGQFYRQMKGKYGGRYYLVEPNQILYDRLSVTEPDKKFRIVISPETKQFAFYNSANNEAGSLQESMAAHWKLTDVEYVDGWTFEYFLGQTGIATIDLLKVDIEGAELDLLANVSAGVLKKIKQITCEFHDFLDESQLPKVRAVIKSLREQGFILWNFSTSHHRDVLMINCKGTSALYRLFLYCLHMVLYSKLKSNVAHAYHS